MSKQKLIKALNYNSNYYYESAGNHPTRVHVLCNHTNQVKVPSKKHEGNYNMCDVAFAHLCEEDDKLYWMKMANHSSVRIGHKCIPDILENLLNSPSVFILDEKGHKMEAKRILDTDIPQIVKYIHNINSTKITLSDVDYDPKR